ncbi:MAG: hypothetical protein WCW44_03990 [archaeon]|jgi:uridine kinase
MPGKTKVRPLLVGICGRSCSGKTSVSRAIAALSPSQILHIEADNFAKAATPHRFNGFKNLDHPQTIKFAKLIRALKALKAGKTVRIPEKRGQRRHGLRVSPKQIIVVDGFLIFSHKELVGLFDKKIFIDVSDETIRVRRIKRNRYPAFDNPDYINKVVIPFSKRYNYLQKMRADVVVNGEEDHEYLVHRVRQHLQI